MFRTFIQFTAFLQTAISAVFLIKGGITISIKDLAELSRARFDYNPTLLKNLAGQRADTRIGFSLLMLSIVLQFLHWLLPFGIGDLGINRKGVILAIVASIPIWIVAHRLSCYLQKKWYTQAENILKKPKDNKKQ